MDRRSFLKGAAAAAGVAMANPVESAIRDPRGALRVLDRLDAEGRLIDFIKQGWPVLEPPTRPFVRGWAVDATCEHLEAVHKDQIRRLLINVPPGCMKSLTTNVFFPAWVWGPKNRPDRRFISWSYSHDLTVRDNRRTRNLIVSDYYQQQWGSRFHLVDDQNAKVKFENNHRGWKLASSVGGVGTGERADLLVIDDPHNVREGESEAIRKQTLLWFTEVVPTRVNDPEKSAIVVIMQRVHQEDVSGLILAQELGYEHLMLPMEFEEKRRCRTSIGFVDPRIEEGQLLWPERFPSDVVERDKKVLASVGGSYAVAGQFQQLPVPREGGKFKREWFAIVDAIPAHARRCRYWDKAGSEGKGDYSAGVKLAVADGIFYVEDVVRGQWSSGNRNAVIRQTAALDGVLTAQWVEQEGGSGGKESAEISVRELAGYDVHKEPVTGDKDTRANPLAAQAEVGNVKVLRGPWNKAFIDEICDFPNGKHDDQLDAASGAFNKLALGVGGGGETPVVWG